MKLFTAIASLCGLVVTSIFPIRIAGYNWWTYYKKIQAASVRIDGPRAVVHMQDSSDDHQPETASRPIRSYGATTITDSEEIALIKSSDSNPELHVNGRDCQTCIGSPAIPEVKSVDSAAVLVSVIVHSPES